MRKTGIDVLGNASWGTHFCLFYQTKKDLIDILVPYFKAGLENNEFCLWITSEPLTAKEAKKVMEKAIPDFDHCLKRGQIEILDHSQWYTKSGKFEAEKILQGWVEKEDQALKRGFDGLRLTGNTAWLEKNDWKKFVDYEATVNNIIGKYRMLSVCTYPLDKCSADEVIDVVYNHQSALIRRNGKWEIIESSEHKQTKETLEQGVKEATLQLKKQHQTQQNFFIDLAHGLKTPLTIMKGSLGLASPKNFAHFLVTQEEEVNRIEKIINDLSTLAKADTKQLTLQFREVGLDKIIEGVCLRLQTTAQREKKKLVIKKLTPLAIRGNRKFLEQLVSNLLDNAIKFTKPRSGQILVSLTKDRGRAKIRIKDNGIGIPKKDLPHVFERFYRSAPVRRSPNLRGSGLGLAICDWIVKEHRGKMTVESESNKGTVFTVFLPHDPKSLIKI